LLPYPRLKSPHSSFILFIKLLTVPANADRPRSLVFIVPVAAMTIH
jgi:hypothetical protein